MKLLEVTISGYKNLVKTTINFTNNQITSLISPNNYGKSNFLESLDFVRNFIHATPNLKNDLMEYSPAIPINKHIDTENFLFSVLFETTYDTVSWFVNYSFEFAWAKEKKTNGTRIIFESLRVKEGKPNSKYASYLKRDERNTFYLPSPSGRCSTTLHVLNDNLAINKLANHDSLFYVRIIEDVLSLNFSITNLMEVERTFNTSPKNELAMSQDDGELRDGFNISQYLYNLKKNKKNKYQLFLNSLKDLIPTIEMIEPIEIDLKEANKGLANKDIPFSLPEKFYDLRVKELNNNQTTGIRFLSRGTKRIILILATAIDAIEKKYTLIAFEELENSIHPSLMQKLLMILSGIAPNLKILISSHSPYLIQYLSTNSIYFGLPNERGLASFYKIKDSKQKSILKLASDQNSSVGDYLFDMMIDNSLDTSFEEEYFEVSR
jgi:AAA15 family ATPase/GTPase